MDLWKLFLLKRVTIGKFFFTILFMFLFSFIYMLLDEDEFLWRDIKHKEFSEVTGYFERLYYSAIVQTTIGLGDIVPNSKRARVITMVQALTTILLIILV